jgi:hypothetical protein
MQVSGDDTMTLTSRTRLGAESSSIAGVQVA